MSLVPFKPSRDLFRLRDEINQMFENFFSGFPGLRETFSPGMTLVADVTETENDIIIEAELPGMKKDDIKISIENDILTIKGECKKEEKKKSHNYRTEERYHGVFQRSFTLPTSANPEKVKAEFKDGILEIVIAKREEARPKIIDITVD